MLHTHTRAERRLVWLVYACTMCASACACASSMWQTFLRTYDPRCSDTYFPSPRLPTTLNFLSFWRFLNFFSRTICMRICRCLCSPKNFVPFGAARLSSACSACQSPCPSPIRRFTPSVRYPPASCACLLLHDCHLAVACPAPCALRPSPFNPPAWFRSALAPRYAFACVSVSVCVFSCSFSFIFYAPLTTFARFTFSVSGGGVAGDASFKL